MDDQPTWITKCIIRDDLHWNKSRENCIDSFYEKYTLHDSYCIGIFHNISYGDSTIIAFEWDADCLNEDLKSSLLNPDDWLYLFIRIQEVKQLLFSGFKKTKGKPRWIQRSISELELVPIDEGRLLVISDKDGGKVKIIFNGESTFLVLDEEQNIIDV